MNCIAKLIAVLVFSTRLLLAETDTESPPTVIQKSNVIVVRTPYSYDEIKKLVAEDRKKERKRRPISLPTETKVLYENNLEKAEVGKLPEEFLVQEGNFIVKDLGTNKVVELPGAPLETFSLFFGPTETSDVLVSAKIFATSKGRRFPTFDVGINGPSGYKLQVSPAKKNLELYRNDELQTRVPFDWKSGEWTNFKLQILKTKDAEWRIEGKAWSADAKEPDEWTLTFSDKTEPIAGRASIWGSPFAGTPIWFDDFAVARIGAK